MPAPSTRATPPPRYRGRFAPSPTGPLHLGSLLAAVGSHLDARVHHGEWLLRIENIDHRRCTDEAADAIFTALEAHGLHWDGAVRHQHRHIEHYRQAANAWLDAGRAYRCGCTRKRLAASGALIRYDGHCRDQPPPADKTAGLRLKTRDTTTHFNDRIQGPQRFSLASLCGDLLIWRRDQIVSYQLAVAFDDLDQAITHVVRGADLLDSTPRQLEVMAQLDPSAPVPRYAHLPVVCSPTGHKLSKQTGAKPLDVRQASQNLHAALTLLGAPPPVALKPAPPGELLEWAGAHWHLGQVPKGPQLSGQSAAALGA